VSKIVWQKGALRFCNPPRGDEFIHPPRALAFARGRYATLGLHVCPLKVPLPLSDLDPI